MASPPHAPRLSLRRVRPVRRGKTHCPRCTHTSARAQHVALTTCVFDIVSVSFRHRVCLFYASRLLLSHPRDWVVCFAVMRLSWSTTSYNGGAHIKVEYGGDAWLALGVSADGHMVRKKRAQKKRAQKTRVNKTKNVSTKTCFIYVSLALPPPRTPAYPLLPQSLALQEQISVMYRKYGV